MLNFSKSSSDGSRAATPAMASDDLTDRASVASRRFTPAPPSIAEDHAMDSIEDIPPPVQEQTTLLHDEEESFALAPVDASALKGKFCFSLFEKATIQFFF